MRAGDGPDVVCLFLLVTVAVTIFTLTLSVSIFRYLYRNNYRWFETGRMVFTVIKCDNSPGGCRVSDKAKTSAHLIRYQRNP